MIRFLCDAAIDSVTTSTVVNGPPRWIAQIIVFSDIPLFIFNAFGPFDCIPSYKFPRVSLCTIKKKIPRHLDNCVSSVGALCCFTNRDGNKMANVRQTF